MVLKAKAFSQLVYSVKFSKFEDEILTTGGMGHIKFWKTAQTFTGLKLKGDLGKFGKIELSNVTSYVILEDRNKVSGTDKGTILVWEGNLIKAVIKKDEQENCHKG